MSLLHEALKKAETEPKGVAPETPFVDREEASVVKSPSLRLTLLIALAVASLGFAGYLHFSKNRSPGVVQAPVETPLGLAGGPGPEILARQAETSLQERRWQEAATLFGKLVILEPRNAEAYNNLGVSLKKIGQREKAHEQYKKALAIRADYPEATNNLGVLYLSEGKLADALNQFRRATELKPEYPEPYFHRAMIEEAWGKTEESRRDYQRYLELAKGVDPTLEKQIRQRLESVNR